MRISNTRPLAMLVDGALFNSRAPTLRLNSAKRTLRLIARNLVVRFSI